MKRSIRFGMDSGDTNSHFTPIDHPVRVAIVGLGHVYELNVRAFLHNADVEIVALVDISDERRQQRQADWPSAKTFDSVKLLASSGLDVDAVEVLVPWTMHEEIVTECLANGWHVNLQKPFATDLASASRMTAAALQLDRQLRIMENYLFYDPLVKLKEVVDSGELGEISGYHMKMVASGRGGWDVPGTSYDWRFEQALLGRGTLFFDDGWHKLSTALWLFGPVEEVRAWIGATEIIPGVTVDAPTTVSWMHTNGVRGVWDITLAVDMYLRSDYFTNDERWEVTGRRGFARVNRCTARGLQQPSLEVYRDGELRSFHALDDDWGNSFRDSGQHWIEYLRTGKGPLLWGPENAIEVLRFALAAYKSSEHQGIGVNPRYIEG